MCEHTHTYLLVIKNIYICLPRKLKVILCNDLLALFVMFNCQDVEFGGLLCSLALGCKHEGHPPDDVASGPSASHCTTLPGCRQWGGCLVKVKHREASRRGLWRCQGASIGSGIYVEKENLAGERVK